MQNGNVTFVTYFGLASEVSIIYLQPLHNGSKESILGSDDPSKIGTKADLLGGNQVTQILLRKIIWRGVHVHSNIGGFYPLTKYVRGGFAERLKYFRKR